HRRRRARAAIDVVCRIAHVAGAARVVRRTPVHLVGEVVVEDQLAGVHDGPADVHLHVDVHGAPAVPAGVDGLELSEPAGVGDLRATQERLIVGRRLGAARTAARSAGTGLAEPGVDATRVAMPYVDRGVLDRRAPCRVYDRELHAEGR